MIHIHQHRTQLMLLFLRQKRRAMKRTIRITPNRQKTSEILKVDTRPLRSLEQEPKSSHLTVSIDNVPPRHMIFNLLATNNPTMTFIGRHHTILKWIMEEIPMGSHLQCRQSTEITVIPVRVVVKRLFGIDGGLAIFAMWQHF